jgi:large subunit ribosomal protein L25
MFGYFFNRALVDRSEAWHNSSLRLKATLSTGREPRSLYGILFHVGAKTRYGFYTSEWVTMADVVVLKAETRTGNGRRDSIRARKKGHVPAIVYGHKEVPEPVLVNHDLLFDAIKHRHRNLTLDIAGKTQAVILQDVQYDYLGKDILHADFRRVDAGERIRVIVPVELRGIAVGTNSGGVIDQPMHTIHIECPGTSVPETIRVRIDDLQIGHSIHVKELKLPEGVKVLEELEAVVVQVKMPGAEPLPAEVPGGNEPEVITAKKKAEDDEAASKK